MVVYKHVNDLGVAAYILMHGYDVAGKKGKSYYFEVSDTDPTNFDSICLEYLNERNYHKFDHCIMSLKKVPTIKPRVKSSPVNDLGLAAYIFMHDFDISGREGNSFFFEVSDSLKQRFEKLTMEYLSSPYHRFDHCIMSLKKVPEHAPK